MAGNNKKKARENYFQQNINRAGPDFLETMPLDKLKLDVVRVFRDLARGNIDIDKYGKYFAEPKFLEACIITADTKYNFHAVSAAGVGELLRQNMQGINTYPIYEFHNNAANAYKIISSSLVEFRNVGNNVILNDLVFSLAKYRNYI